MIPEKSASAPGSARPFQFRLVTLFGVTTVAAFALAIWVNWELVGGVLIFLASLVGVLTSFAGIRLAIHLLIGQVSEQVNP